jgi:hypothetical protein
MYVTGARNVHFIKINTYSRISHILCGTHHFHCSKWRYYNDLLQLTNHHLWWFQLLQLLSLLQYATRLQKSCHLPSENSKSELANSNMHLYLVFWLYANFALAWIDRRSLEYANLLCNVSLWCRVINTNFCLINYRYSWLQQLV